MWPLLAFFLIALIGLGLARAGLIAWQWERVRAVDGLWPVLLYGLRMDVSLLCILLLGPALVALAVPGHVAVQRLWRPLLAFALTAIAVVLIFMEAATPSYINQYGVRPSRIFVEYLIYPREVFSTLWGAYKLQLLMAAVLVVATAVVVWRHSYRQAARAPSWRWWQRLLVLPLVFALMVVGARSSFGHRAVNASTVAFSSDPLVNSLALSSAYSVLHAVYGLRYESGDSRYDGTLPPEEVLARIRANMDPASREFLDPAIPTLHRQRPSRTLARPLNLVIVLEESLGAQFVGALGGLPLTPELDRLAREGWWFTRLYATGTRSVRGIEAVITGFPPTPAPSVVKLGLAQDGFYTLARTLRAHGYTTEFIYGGESHFDNMAGFFLNNGFERVIDERDFAQPGFRGSWGVSDEDLFERAHAEFLQHGDRPFFALVFSSSFHSPFEFPDGRIELYEQPKQTERNAVKYADYALGKFFQKAKQAPYWANTLFLVVADHDARVYGASLVPIERFHIPGLILGPGIRPQQYTKPASQIDLAPTLLSLLGLHSEHPMIGHDLTRLPAGFPGRAIMQYENNHAYLRGEEVVIHEPRKPGRQFRYAGGRLVPVEHADEELVRDALAHALWPSAAYRDRSYRLAR